MIAHLPDLKLAIRFRIASPNEINCIAMFDKISALFKGSQPSPEQLYKEQHQIEYAQGKGYIVGGVVLNEALSARLEYLSNRRMSAFDDLKALYGAAMIINEKIDLEIARQNFNIELGNTAENLQDFKQLIQVLSEYYRNFLREHKKKGR